MSQATGPGRVVLDPRVPVGGIRAVLTNFDVDVATLKPEHIAFLDRSVVPVVRGRRARVWLRGQASHTGSRAHNLELSHRRAQSVIELLKARGIPETVMQIEWVGDSLAGPFSHEDAGQRAVSLFAAPLAVLPPPQPPPVPVPAMPTAKTFKIRLLGGLSAGAGPVQVEQLYFQIWDYTHGIASIYLYDSAGFGKGVGVAVSTTLQGDWNTFATSGELAVNQFGGAARFSTAGGAKWTWNYLNAMGLPPGIKTIPNPLALETGFTVGLGVSTSLGKMILGFTGPFTGR